MSAIKEIFSDVEFLFYTIYRYIMGLQGAPLTRWHFVTQNTYLAKTLGVKRRNSDEKEVGRLVE